LCRNQKFVVEFANWVTIVLQDLKSQSNKSNAGNRVQKSFLHEGFWEIQRTESIVRTRWQEAAGKLQHLVVDSMKSAHTRPVTASAEA
jgi:hypothetical protein